MGTMMILYHGTSDLVLDQILKNGLKPRGRKRSLWKEHPSASDRVYLTKAYAVYFACHAKHTMGGNGLILEVDVDPQNLVADEDALAQADRFNAPLGGSIKEKTKFWRKEAPFYPHLAEFSLRVLGNAAHMGVIPPSQIKKHLVFPVTPDLIYGHDPSITVMNYAFMGQSYVNALSKFVETDGKEGRVVKFEGIGGDELWQKVC
jgi:hypothetical protein